MRSLSNSPILFAIGILTVQRHIYSMFVCLAVRSSAPDFSGAGPATNTFLHSRRSVTLSFSMFTFESFSRKLNMADTFFSLFWYEISGFKSPQAVSDDIPWIFLVLLDPWLLVEVIFHAGHWNALLHLILLLFIPMQVTQV